MDAANFACDLTQLLMRYTMPKSPPNQKEELADGPTAPLTPEVIVEIVQESLRTVLHASKPLASLTADVYKTPANDIVINTPNAPAVTRASLNGHENGMVSKDCREEISDIMEMSAEKKDRSPSSMHLSAIGRSDTFVHEDDNPISKDVEKSLGNGVVSDKINDDVLKTKEKMSDGTLQPRLDALRQCAVDVIAKIDEIAKPTTTTEPSKPIRRLSSVGAYSCTARNSSMMRSIQPSKIRRSFTTFPGTTPTSSRLNSTVVLCDNLSKRKSTSNVSLHVTTTNASSNETTASSKLLIPPSKNVRSNTSLSLPITKKSPGSDGRAPKNPKYAHIQSSIPKPSVLVNNKRKNQ